MSPHEIVEMLQLGNFEPCVFITNAGGRYEVRHPEFVRTMANGTIHVYEPTAREDVEIYPFARVAPRNIAAIEPLRMQSSQ